MASHKEGPRRYHYTPTPQDIERKKGIIRAENIERMRNSNPNAEISQPRVYRMMIPLDPLRNPFLLAFLSAILFSAPIVNAQFIGPRIIYQQAGGNAVCSNGHCGPLGCSPSPASPTHFRLAPTIVQVRASDHLGRVAYATGIVLDETHDKAYILTVSHATTGMDTAEVLIDGRRYPATIVGEDSRRDIALLTTAPLGQGRAATTEQYPATGAPVLLGGWAEGRQPILIKGTMDRADGRSVVIRGHAELGQSGGPIISDGKVIGMIVDSTSDRVTGPSITAIRTSLARYLPRWSTPPAPTHPPPAISSHDAGGSEPEANSLASRIAAIETTLESIRSARCPPGPRGPPGTVTVTLIAPNGEVIKNIENVRSGSTVQLKVRQFLKGDD